MPDMPVSVPMVLPVVEPPVVVLPVDDEPVVRLPRVRVEWRVAERVEVLVDIDGLVVWVPVDMPPIEPDEVPVELPIEPLPAEPEVPPVWAIAMAGIASAAAAAKRVNFMSVSPNIPLTQRFGTDGSSSAQLHWARWSNAWSASTSATMASTTGTPRMPTHGS